MGIFHKKARVIKRREPETIGIVGAVPGSGTTHLALSLSYYLSGGMGRRTACVEMSQGRALAGLEQSVYGEEGRGQEFAFCGVTFVKDGAPSDFVKLINRDYEEVIADMGREYERVRLDFLRCQKKMVTVSFCPWQEEDFEWFMEGAAFEEGYREWIYCCCFGQPEAIRRAERRFGITVRKVPFQQDFYHLTGQELECFRRILG